MIDWKFRVYIVHRSRIEFEQIFTMFESIAFYKSGFASLRKIARVPRDQPGSCDPDPSTCASPPTPPWAAAQPEMWSTPVMQHGLSNSTSQRVKLCRVYILPTSNRSCASEQTVPTLYVHQWRRDSIRGSSFERIKRSNYRLGKERGKKEFLIHTDLGMIQINHNE